MGAVQCCEAVKDDSCAVADVSSWALDHGVDIAKGTLLDRTATGGSGTSTDPKVGPFWSSGADATGAPSWSASGADAKAQLRLPIPHAQLRAVSSTSGRSSRKSDSPSSMAGNGPASRINSPCLTDAPADAHGQAAKLAREQSRGLKTPLESAKVLPRPPGATSADEASNTETEASAAAAAASCPRRTSGSVKPCEGRTLSGTTGTTAASELSEKKGLDSDLEPALAQVKAPSAALEERQASKEKMAKKEKKEKKGEKSEKSEKSERSKGARKSSKEPCKDGCAKEAQVNDGPNVPNETASELAGPGASSQTLRRSDTWVLAKAGSKEDICFVLQKSPKSKERSLRKSNSKESVKSDGSNAKAAKASSTAENQAKSPAMPFRSEPKLIQLQIPDLPPAESSEKEEGDNMGPRTSGSSVASATSACGAGARLSVGSADPLNPPTLSPRSRLAPPAPTTSKERRTRKEGLRRKESSTSESTIFSELGMTMQRSNSSTQPSLGRRSSGHNLDEATIQKQSIIANMVALRRSSSVQSEQGTFAENMPFLASAKQLTQAISKGAKLVDLRRDAERRAGPNLLDSVPIEWESSRRAMCTDKLPDKRTPVIVFCSSGRRASMAKEYLCDQGYRTVLNAGGPPHFEQWQALTLTVGLAGYAV